MLAHDFDRPLQFFVRRERIFIHVRKGSTVTAPKVNFNWLSVLAILLGWLVSAVLAYGAVDARVRVLEDRYERLLGDIQDIKRDVRELVNRP